MGIGHEKRLRKGLKEKKKPAEKHVNSSSSGRNRDDFRTPHTLYRTGKQPSSQQPSTPTIKGAFYYGLGYLHALQARETGEALDTAIAHLQHAVEINPDLFWARFNLGGIYQDQDKDDLALAEFEACVRLKSNYYPAHYRMGEIHLKRQDYLQALHAFDTARESK